ncbi:DUF5059 domain-containing protein [Halomicrococcus gelatinilyticus]|uniref:DUF5059 domain-containing protein n=1 Tax=Halomicrococcus gelatinilyticus TaxID=1702103 RepID=UPI002E0E30CC
MQTNRRDLLKAGGGLVASTLVAGCGAQLSASGETGGSGANAAVAAEWNAMRARLYDAQALAVAGEFDAGASVAEDVFARFEAASGEWGAHEKLEETSEKQYEEFEEALGQLTSRLREGNQAEVDVEVGLGDDHLRAAQERLVGEANVRALDLQLFGTRVENAAMLAAAGKTDAAATVAGNVLGDFESSPVHDALESAASESYEAFESAAKTAKRAANDGNVKMVLGRANAAVTAAVEGSYAVADAKPAAGAGHLAAMQGQAFDAKALASLGGPSTAYAHAAALNVYRARVADCAWLVSQGATDRAKQVATDVFAHFEGAKAHEALEEADHDAYESFEGGLETLSTAAGSGDRTTVASAIDQIDGALVAGIEALASGTAAAVLQSGFFRARFGDAMELQASGETTTAASIARSLFERFEADELGFHEALEDTSEKLYERFEHEHLKEGLIPALENGNGSAANTHFDGVQQALLDFEAKAGAPALASGAEAAMATGRAFDAAGVAALGDGDRAATVVEDAYSTFEAGAAGYHEALEEADHDAYEQFETRLVGVGEAASGDGDPYAAAKRFNGTSVGSLYAIVDAAGGDYGPQAATVVQDVFGQFEKATVHELLEEGDHATYEAFESALNDYATALKNGDGVDAAADAFASAALRGQFAVVGAVDKAPVDGESGSDESGGGHDEGLTGGPNVQQGVPDDADHVVDMKAVSFEPAELTVKQGDTVAWKHAGGEAHSVTAYEAEIPEAATYFASGGFDSEEAAREGWEAGKGAVQSGQSYVHTFETEGTFEYVCVPHEAAGMKGTIVVE